MRRPSKRRRRYPAVGAFRTQLCAAAGAVVCEAVAALSGGLVIAASVAAPTVPIGLNSTPRARGTVRPDGKAKTS